MTNIIRFDNGEILPLDIISNISKFCEPITTYKLLSIHPVLYTELSQNFSQYLASYIYQKLREKFATCLPILDHILFKLKAYVSGSFILSCIHDTEWKSSDVDFYCLGEYQYDIFPEDLYKHYNVKSFTDINYSEFLNADAYGLRRCECQGIKFDLITLKEAEDIGAWIIKTFDFDICMNWLYIDQTHGNIPTLECSNLSAILEKKITIKNKNQNNGLLSRVGKYFRRGFTIINLVNYLDNISELDQLYINSSESNYIPMEKLSNSEWLIRKNTDTKSKALKLKLGIKRMIAKASFVELEGCKYHNVYYSDYDINTTLIQIDDDTRGHMTILLIN